jgi:hypothetical protein
MQEKKEFVVVQNGQRQSGLLTQEAANQQAEALRKQINEQAGQKTEASQVAVKQNLFG